MNHVIVIALGVLLCNSWWPDGPCSRPIPVIAMFTFIFIMNWVDSLPDIEDNDDERTD